MSKSLASAYDSTAATYRTVREAQCEDVNSRCPSPTSCGPMLGARGWRHLKTADHVLCLHGPGNFTGEGYPTQKTMINVALVQSHRKAGSAAIKSIRRRFTEEVTSVYVESKGRVQQGKMGRREF